MFDLGLQRLAFTTFRRFGRPVAGVRLYFRCGCRGAAAVFPWIEEDAPGEWYVLDIWEGWQRRCDERAHEDPRWSLIDLPSAGGAVPARSGCLSA